YVVRAKAGQRQAAKDAGGGKTIQSAGSSLRRHNEVALQRDIEALLVLWKPHLADSERIVVHAPGSINRNSVFLPGVLARSDPRVRLVPFPTRRPTLPEVSRVSRVHVHLLTVQTYARPVALVQRKGYAAPRSAPQVKKAKEEGGEEDPVTEVGHLVAKGNMPAIRALAAGGYWWMAAAGGHFRMVAFLLEEGADPCALDARAKTPYEVAKSKEERDAIRRFAGKFPERWEWDEARIGSALTEDLERSQKEKEDVKKDKEKQRKKEQERRKKERDREAKEAADKQVNSKTPEGTI
ncbi:hypothetical protein T484DRAFT_1830927, partial [Baffinella frigidus]